ncbi:hypothetical protein [Saccharopolyspora mangrovi]|uniref:Uncharacterized protein n=1 Tax=Saccharopolyspora mangrovi TaxID=3082379 RepID=A0ABU6AEV5_9PSEU|nr:hypothetical protein [Saccharopolyspora sp. S2-29]MEB3370077.1 hypothetical protein [Saccharopolyspora sp. S2-29]
MTRAEHYRKAEEYLNSAEGAEGDDESVQRNLLFAQAHATLALASENRDEQAESFQRSRNW